jgi:hypothetical protein
VCEETLLSICKDSEKLIIKKKVAVKGPLHILEPDPHEVEKLRKFHEEK